MRQAIAAFLFCVALCGIALPARAKLRPVAGEFCLSSGLALQMDLPFGPTSKGTEIVNIVGLGADDGTWSAWIYTNRRGQEFLQVRPGYNASAARVLAAANAPGMANTARVMGLMTFVRIPPKEALGLIGRLQKMKDVVPCFTRPLP